MLLAVASYCNAEDYFVSSSEGNDANDGLSPATAWKTTTRVNQASFGLGEIFPGNSILFKRGDVWGYADGSQLRLISGTVGERMRYSNYGSGEEPIISRSVFANSPSQWLSQGGNIWSLNQEMPSTDSDTADIWYNSDESIGTRKWSLAGLGAQGEFYADEIINGWDTNKIIYMYSIGNPANYYNNIAVATGELCTSDEKSNLEYINFDGITFYQCWWRGVLINKEDLETIY